MLKISQSPPGPQPASPLEPELALLARIFTQALRDVRDPDPAVQAAAIRWWREGSGGDLAHLCEMLGLDLKQVQAYVARRYPEILAPRQLELELEVAS